MVVPRGAFLRSPVGIVARNQSFAGLGVEDAKSLENWLHFTGPVKLPKKSLLVGEERGPGVDAPLIKLRSLHWRGSEAVHIPKTNQFARAYFGDGIKNINLPFMLPIRSSS